LIDNTINVGSGNDTVYGTLHDINMMGENGGIIGGYLGSYNFGPAYNSFTFGNNTINAGSGNDTVYGAMHDLNMSSDQSTIGGINGGFNSFVFGDETISGGDGNNILYGSMHDITLLAKSGFIGNFTNVIGDPNYNSLTFGNNTVTGGNGSDILYADMHNLILMQDSMGGITNNTITFGNSVLNAGTGNTTLVGEVFHIDDNTINPFLPDTSIVNAETIANFLANNKVIAGETTFNLHGYTPANPMTSGTGIDTLVFDPAVNIGQNTVNGFVSATDVLQFNNVLPTGTEATPSFTDLANLIQSISSDGHGGTLVTFNHITNDAAVNVNGTIDFTGISHTETASTTTSAISTDLLHLVNNQLGHIVIIV
jgi:hypothetical protein